MLKEKREFGSHQGSYYAVLFLQYNASSFRVVGILNTKISADVIFPPIFMFFIFQYFSHYFDMNFRTRAATRHNKFS
jgi:hypothetical protein